MKYTWEKEDIKCGVFYHRGYTQDDSMTLSPKELKKSLAYAVSCLHKIGALSIFSEDKSHLQFTGKNPNRIYYALAMTDGIVFPLGTVGEAAESLTRGGYHKTTQQELIDLIKSSRKNFRLQ